MRKCANTELIPYPVIAAAVQGDPDAVNQVIDHYSGYIADMSVRKSYDQNGNVCFTVDEDIVMHFSRSFFRTKLVNMTISIKTRHFLF